MQGQRTGYVGSVLAAEGNAIHRRVMEHAFRELNLPFRIVNNADAAMRAFRRERPALIFLDVMEFATPSLDGFSAARHLRRIEQRGKPGRRVAIVALTANALAQDWRRCLEAGIDDYLAKPLTPARIAEKIERWMPLRSVRRFIEVRPHS